MTLFEDRTSQSSPHNGRLYLVLLTLVTAAFCVWVLSLPLFPSQDGPIHLYYTTILHDLLFHTSTVYSRFYTIKHLLPPYSLYYYLLMLLAQFTSIVAADKIVICVYMVTFAFGMRYLASSIGPNGDLTALLATPLLLNWPLAMGFVNFCLSTAIALWALGLWCRSNTQQSHPRKVGFVLLSGIIMLTHPVPLLLLLGFCLVELVVRLLQHRGPLHIATPAHRTHSPQSATRQLLTDAIYLAIACSTLIYVKIFTAAHVLAQQPHPTQSRLHLFLVDLTNYVLLRSLSVFGGNSLLDGVHRLSLVLILLASLFFAIRQLRGNLARHLWTLADTWTCIALCALLVMPFVPNDLNHSHFFAYRLILLLWIAALVAGSGYTAHIESFRPIAAAFSVLAAALVLLMAHTRIDPQAQRIAEVQTQPPFVGGRVGLMLLSRNHDRPANLSYDPYLWAGTHFFRRTGSVLYDSPWLDLAIIPLGPQAIMPTGIIDPEALEEYIKLRPLLERSSSARNLIDSHIDFAVINNGSAPPEADLDPVLVTGPQDSSVNHHQPWACKPYTWYSICQRVANP